MDQRKKDKLLNAISAIENVKIVQTRKERTSLCKK